MSAHGDLSEQAAVYQNGALWASGPQVVYDRLADRAVDELGDVAGLTVLDAGAGTGGASRALLRRGAQVAAADLSASMLAELERQTGGRVPTTVAHVCALPMADATYDAAIAAYLINHLDRPADAIVELARVTRPGGLIVATTFGVNDHPIKSVVDAVLAGYGFVAPGWYLDIKTKRMPLTSTESALVEVGERGGLREVTVTLVEVNLSDLMPDALAAYRLRMPHITSFVETLDTATQAEMTAAVIRSVQRLPPLQLPMLVLRGRSPG